MRRADLRVRQAGRVRCSCVPILSCTGEDETPGSDTYDLRKPPNVAFRNGDDVLDLLGPQRPRQALTDAKVP